MCKEFRMRGVCLLGLLVGLTGIIRAENSIFSGYLGCRFSQSICRRNEECIDDHLFGQCQSLYKRRDMYQYSLDSSQLGRLEKEVRRLIRSRNTWEDLYTQCVLSNVLYSFRWQQEYDPEFCDNGGVRNLQQDLSDTAVALLKSYLETYYNAVAQGKDKASPDLWDNGKSSDGPFDDLPSYDRPEIPNPDEKKDELVQVHKYMKSHKRDPYLSDYPDYSTPSVDRTPEYQSYDITDEYPGYPGDMLGSLTPDKLALLQEYFGPVTDNVGEKPNSPTETIASDNTDIYDNIIGPIPTDDNYAVVASMEPEDAELLDDLLQGKAEVSSLSDDKIERLTQYVDAMLSSLRRIQPEVGSEETGDKTDLDIPQLEVPETEEDQSAAQPQIPDVPAVHKAVKKEQSNQEVLASDPEGNSQVADEDLRDPNPTKPQFGVVDLDVAYIKVEPDIKNKDDAATLLVDIERHLQLPDDTFASPRLSKNEINFHVKSNLQRMNASAVASQAKLHADEIKNETGYFIYEAGVGSFESKVPLDTHEPKYFVLTFVLCGVIAGIVLAVIAIYIVRRHLQSKEKLAQLSGAADGVEASNDYQDLCRQRMQSKSSEKPEPLHVASRVGSVSATESAVRSPSSRSSTSSWSEEPVASNMDISTGHIVLSYMEDHLKNKDRLDREWEALCAYDAEPNSISTASETSNMRKNRYSDILPYDHSRVALNAATNVSGSDYINASTITDHDPRNPAYIATQGPLPHTVADFWQMIWEQGSVVIVNLTRLTENGQAMCHRYWPEEGSDLYHIYEVHLVSEHIWCDDYLVRSFYLKNLQTNETRTVTQFHFLTWTDLGIPGSAKALLDFRRKVNKSYRGRSCPVVVHCSDGSGRSGTYSLVDMVLNRMSKGAKEIDIAATLEHIRDQRMQMVKTKEQFEFALAAVAEEVHAILKALPQ